jgi:hypothetical protein
MRDPTDLHQQALDATAQRQRDELNAKQERDDLIWLMGTKPGRRIASRILGTTGVYRNPFNNSGSVMAFNCGQMNVGQQWLAQIMEHAPDRYLELLKEAKTND